MAIIHVVVVRGLKRGCRKCRMFRALHGLDFQILGSF